MLEICRKLQVSWSSPASKAASSLSCSAVLRVCEVRQGTARSLSRCGARALCRGAYTSCTGAGVTPRRASAIHGEVNSQLRPWLHPCRVLCPRARTSSRKQLLRTLSQATCLPPCSTSMSPSLGRARGATRPPHAAQCGYAGLRSPGGQEQ